MFQFLCIFGPAAVTFLIYIGLTDKKVTNYFTAVLQIILFAMLNTEILFILLSPLKLVRIIQINGGIHEIRYTGTAFVLSLPVAAVLGVVSAMAAKRVQLRLEITEKKKDTADETSKMD